MLILSRIDAPASPVRAETRNRNLLISMFATARRGYSFTAPVMADT
jgi:hypothetical protein